MPVTKPKPKTAHGRNAKMIRQHQFKKGVKPHAGRAKGTPNRTTKLLKEAILQAAELVGENGKGHGGLTGYLMHLARKEKAVYARLLEKVLPLQVNVEDKTVKKYTAEEMIQQLQERKLPIPPGLIQIASSVAIAVSSLEDEYKDELSGVGLDSEGEDDEVAA